MTDLFYRMLPHGVFVLFPRIISRSCILHPIAALPPDFARFLDFVPLAVCA